MQMETEIEKMKREIEKAKADLPVHFESLERELKIKQSALEELIAAQKTQQAKRARPLGHGIELNKGAPPPPARKPASPKTPGLKRHNKGKAQ